MEDIPPGKISFYLSFFPFYHPCRSAFIPHFSACLLAGSLTFPPYTSVYTTPYMPTSPLPCLTPCRLAFPLLCLLPYPFVSFPVCLPACLPTFLPTLLPAQPIAHFSNYHITNSTYLYFLFALGYSLVFLFFYTLILFLEQFWNA